MAEIARATPTLNKIGTSDTSIEFLDTTASVASFANTLGQFSGATVLAASGYVGISLNTQPGNALTEYRGIWLSGLVGMAIMAALGTAAYIALRAGWGGRPAMYFPGAAPAEVQRQ